VDTREPAASASATHPVGGPHAPAGGWAAAGTGSLEATPAPAVPGLWTGAGNRRPWRLASPAMFLVEVVGGLLRPASCLACGAAAAWPCCASCLPPDPGDVGPWPLAADPEVACWALGPYRDALRAAVLAGKLDGQPAALAVLGRRLGVALAAAGIGADLVTWVAARRVAGRPRDHAERIAGGIAAALDLPLVDLLAPACGPDLGRARRAARPGRPPPTRPPPTARRRLAGGRVLLVDDLATTGATLAGAAAALRQAGARQVEAAVLASARSAFEASLAPSIVPAQGGRIVWL
jgi:predicted amidophosphoribosyltransferase